MSASTTQVNANNPYVPPAMAPAMASASAAPVERKEELAKDTIAPAVPQDGALTVAKPAAKTAIVIDDAEIPLIDLDAIMNATGEARAPLVKAFGDGLRQVGFIAIKAESLTPLIKQVTQQLDKYSAQSLDVKKKDDHKNGGQTGFSQRGSETAAGATEPDNKEFFHISPTLDKWPEFEGDAASSAEFKEVMQAYHKALTEYAAKLMVLVEEYLGEKTEDVHKSVSSAPNLLRLIHYPQTASNAPRAAAHCDLNALTLLPPATEPGLQLLDKQGRWKAVTVPEGYLIVNTGEQLEIKTAGKIKATRHQVMKLEENALKRLASVFFASWSPEFLLKAFASCIAEMTAGMSDEERAKYLSKYPEVTVADNLLSRLIEMRTIKEPAEALVRDLHGKGLLREPTAELKAKYPDLFGKKEEGKQGQLDAAPVGIKV